MSKPFSTKRASLRIIQKRRGAKSMRKTARAFGKFSNKNPFSKRGIGTYLNDQTFVQA